MAPKSSHSFTALAIIGLCLLAAGARAETLDRLQLPMAFEANRGQSEARVQFLARGPGYGVFLGGAEAVLALRASPSADARATVRMSFAGADAAARAEGLAELPGRSHYLIGRDRARWKTGIPTYEKVRYADIYPGVDLVYYGNQRELEYDLVVKPGGDPRAIVLAFEGIEALDIDARGDLVVSTNGGRLVQRAPMIYQQQGDTRQRIEGRYVLKDARRVSIELAAYDASRALVIDPVLAYSTYLGGSGFGESAAAIAVDASGNAYVTGVSSSTDFPVFPSPGAAQDTNAGGVDAFVTKLNASGTSVVYSTYLGGSADDVAQGIAVDGSGNAYVVGRTESANFPVPNAFQPAFGGGTDAFLVKLNAAGTAILYGTYLGGAGLDEARGVAVDAAGHAYVTGPTTSIDFPTSTGAYQTTLRGVGDAFVAKLDTTAAAAGSRVYATYVGGADFGVDDHGFPLGPEGERATAIAVDGAGNAYITGSTLSSDFPIMGAAQASAGGFRNAFVSKLNASGSALVYSTFLGGNTTDEGMGIAVDAAGNAYVTGFTTSLDFPTVGAFQPTRGALGADAFVTKLNAAGSSFVYSTYLGGANDDFGAAIAVDATGRAVVSGTTFSTNFPVRGTLRPFAGSADAFVARLNAAGFALDYSTLLGGNAFDSGRSIALDASGAAYVAGGTSSADFPTTPGAFQAALNGAPGDDGFVAKISPADGIVGAAGGGVTDSAGGASFFVPAGVLATPVSVTIDVLAAPVVAPPTGFTGPGTAFVSIALSPNPSPLPQPGATIRLPLVSALAPASAVALFKYDPATGTLTNTGIVGTVDPDGTTATFTGVTGFSVFVGYLPPAVTPFASFTAKLELSNGKFELKAQFTLGAASDGVSPATETVRLDVGAASLTVPAGAFKADSKGRFKFEGTIGAARVESVIRPVGARSYELTAEVRGADVGAVRPVSVRLAIGNDEGRTSVTPDR